MVVIAFVMTELGIETGATVEAGVKEMIAERIDVMQDVMITIDHPVGTEIFLKAVWIGIEAAEIVGLQGVTETNLRSRWEAARRAQVLLRKRRNLRLI